MLAVPGNELGLLVISEAKPKASNALLDKLASTLREFYGDDPQKSPDYCRVINARHHKRLMALILMANLFGSRCKRGKDRAQSRPLDHRDYG